MIAGGLLALVLAVAGVPVQFVAPTHYGRSGSDCGDSSAALSRPVLCYGYLGTPLAGKSYPLGYAAPGDTVSAVLLCAPGSYTVWVTASADSGRTWSCWASDTATAGPVAGDADGNGVINALDLAVILQRAASDWGVLQATTRAVRAIP